MQSAAKLIERVQDLIKDGSFGPSFILEKLNDGLAEVTQITRPPDLVAVDVELVLAPGDKFVSMPADFFGPRILKLYNKTDDYPCITVYRFVDLAHLSRQFQGAEVRAGCLKGKKLHVAGVPAAATTLEASYLIEPTILESVDDDGAAITYLPFRLGERAIVSYAAWQIYNIIEDGIDGKKVNTDKHHADFLDAMAKIVDHFGMEAREAEPETVPDLMGISAGCRTGSTTILTGNL